MALTFYPQGVLGLLLLLHREDFLYPNARLQTAYIAGSVDEAQVVRALYLESGDCSKLT